MSGSDPTPESGSASGLRSLGQEHFSVAEAVGGWRGLIESVAPGLVFVVVFVITSELAPSLIASLAVAGLAVLARLIRRGPATYAFGGVFGVVIGAIWAWRSGEAQNYYAWGFLTNGAFVLACGISLALGAPLVGIVVSALGLSRKTTQDHDGEVEQGSRPTQVLDMSWRADRELVRRYSAATWLWLAAFVLRLLVQIPLYLGEEVGWLGTARLVMGVPMWALVLWFTWLLVRPRAEPEVPERGEAVH